jgi:hypothetical protein
MAQDNKQGRPFNQRPVRLPSAPRLGRLGVRERGLGLKWSMIRMRAILTISILLGVPGPGYSEIIGGIREDVDFVKGDKRKGLTWSDGLSWKKGGLTLKENKKSDVWIESKKFTVGMAWRPPSIASASLVLEGEIPAKAFTAKFRYSCDGKLWSEWKSFSASEDGRTFNGDVKIPGLSRRKYEALKKKWLNTKPNWKDDEDELCRWIAKEHPKFFEEEIPILGYMQYRLEATQLDPKTVITELRYSCRWGVSGAIHGIPPKSELMADEKWYFPQPFSDREDRKSSKDAPAKDPP